MPSRHCSGPPIGGFPPISQEFLTPQSSVQIYWEIGAVCREVWGSFTYQIFTRYAENGLFQPHLLIARTIPVMQCFLELVGAFCSLYTGLSWNFGTGGCATFPRWTHGMKACPVYYWYFKMFVALELLVQFTCFNLKIMLRSTLSLLLFDKAGPSDPYRQTDFVLQWLFPTTPYTIPLSFCKKQSCCLSQNERDWRWCRLRCMKWKYCCALKMFNIIILAFCLPAEVS